MPGITPIQQGLVGVSPKIGQPLMRLQKRLLDDPGHVELSSEARIEIEPGLQPKEGPELFES